jgi:glycosyltransferase involved in cell wall biosynthesis
VTRRCLLVLGMHRSGTSALTRTLGLLGGTLPRETMPAVADNPRGYWEPPGITRFNNRLLDSAGTRWNDEAAISTQWFTDPARGPDREEAGRLVDDAYPEGTLLVCKDPRICRLLPFWRGVFEAAGIQLHPLLILRDPLEVGRSLAARAENPAFRPAAVVSPARSLLLWLRYVLDAERHTRDLDRHVVRYDSLLDDWRAELEPLLAGGLLPMVDETASAAVDTHLDQSLRRNRLAAADREAAGGLQAGLVVARRLRDVLRPAGGSLGGVGLPADALDRLAASFDRLVADHQPLRRSLDPRADDDPWADRILTSLEPISAAIRSPGLQPKSAAAATPRAVFISGVPDSVGHIYRVEHPVAALEASGWRAYWVPLDAPAAETEPLTADLVVIFRAPWDERLARIAAGCRARGVPVVYDVDDLVFDPELFIDGSVAVMETMAPEDRRLWAAAPARHRETLAAADAATLTTRPLAAAAGRHCPSCFVLPNALDSRMEAAAAAALDTPKDSATDGRPRLCFASGTASHHRDFAVAAEGIARLFARRPEPFLVVIGHLDYRIYDCLLPFADRIEWRPPVPLLELFCQLARCDINLAPLELGNPFCESKSAVRCLFAAAVGLPTVASPTAPLAEAIVNGETGLLAADVADWEEALERLVADAGLRERLGGAARLHALAVAGSAAYRDQATAVFRTITNKLGGLRRPPQEAPG